MKVTVIIYSNDSETVWNAFRLANSLLGCDDTVSVFLLGKGVECVTLHGIKYDIPEQMKTFREYGGILIGCGLCCETRTDTMPLLKDDLNCELGSMQTLCALVKEADRVLTF